MRILHFFHTEQSLSCIYNLIVAVPVLSVSFEVTGWGKDVGGWENEHRRCKPLGGSGGMLPQKILKSRCWEMPFPAFSNRYFPVNWQCKLGNKTLLVIVILTESAFLLLVAAGSDKRDAIHGIHDVLNAQGFAMHYRAILNRSSHFDFRCLYFGVEKLLNQTWRSS